MHSRGNVNRDTGTMQLFDKSWVERDVVGYESLISDLWIPLHQGYMYTAYVLLFSSGQKS